MKTWLKSSAFFVSATLTLAFIWQLTAFAQTKVENFPYGPYNWTGAATLNGTGGGDGNYRTSSDNPAPKWTVFSIGGAGDNGPCAAVSGFDNIGKESNLDLVLNTSGKSFNGTETYSFSVKVNFVPASGVGTIRVQQNSSGSFVDIPNSSSDLSALSTTHDTYLGGILLPTSMENKASVTLRIVIKCLSNSTATPAVFVDDNSISGGALPIQLASSAANVIRDNDVELTWKTISETNNYGFEIQRKRGETGDWRKIGFVEGHGTTLAPYSYSYIDRSVSFGKYYYRIKQVDLDGKSETFPPMGVNVGVTPDKFILAQNYPNPFNPSTLIEFIVPRSGFATLKVYNVLGQEVAILFEGEAEAGKIYSARFDAPSLPSGLYFYTLKTDGKIETKRMLLLK